MQLSACSPLSRRQLEHCTPASVGSSGVDVNESKHTLETVKQEKVPTTHEEKEKYFMVQVAMDEWLSAKGLLKVFVQMEINCVAKPGPKFNLPAALCFYRALRVYPSPVEPIVIYEWTIPPPVRFSIMPVGFILHRVLMSLT
ncbi:hypothetical protein EDD17DRAFT_1491511 [Pisolithus thermaeus]|nr:hypothetical protein EV401DRAFT_1867407 [Pisolithus croceorrhizus]KAI6151407.1 hypothetical protein EDD17DRAFT_1491511 [Pisolithus thermaeus]